MNHIHFKVRPGIQAFLLGGALVIGLSGLAFARFEKANQAPAAKLTRVGLSINTDAPQRENTGGIVTSFAPVVKSVAQSVVKVNIKTKAREIAVPQMPFNDDDIFRRFFGGGNQRTLRVPREEGMGSGVVVTKDGYILTNNHVVEEADGIRVILNDGREFPAKVVGRDPKTDIAVLKINAKDLPYLTIADSDKIEVGDVCLAIGNPFGIGQTVTLGIISAKGRGSVAGLDTGYEDFIQTDAAINPGNSGGALVDAQGRLIGINTAILSRSGGNQGIGFAVPINMARNVMESLISNGKVVRGFVGVLPQDMDAALAQTFKLPNHNGALISEVVPNSPADKAGVQVGDIVTEFNHKPIEDSRHFRLAVAETTPGATVPVKVLRDGSQKELKLTVKEMAGSEEVAKAPEKAKNSNDTLNGVTVADIDAQARKQFNIPMSLKGAVVTDVEVDCPAYEKGLRPGDVIEEINHKPVSSADDAVKLTENVKDKVTQLRVWNRANGQPEGVHRFIAVDETKNN